MPALLCRCLVWFGFGFETLAGVKSLHLRTRKRELSFLVPQEGSRDEGGSNRRVLLGFSLLPGPFPCDRDARRRRGNGGTRECPGVSFPGVSMGFRKKRLVSSPR